VFAQGYFVFLLVWIRGYGHVHFLCANIFISGSAYSMYCQVFGSLRPDFVLYSYNCGTSHMYRFCNS
jgi:hypothetical protein